MTRRLRSQRSPPRSASANRCGSARADRRAAPSAGIPASAAPTASSSSSTRTGPRSACSPVTAITKQSMARLVAHLERHGYVRRVPDPSDRRAKLVRATARGSGSTRSPARWSQRWRPIGPAESGETDARAARDPDRAQRGLLLRRRGDRELPKPSALAQLRHPRALELQLVAVERRGAQSSNSSRPPRPALAFQVPARRRREAWRRGWRPVGRGAFAPTGPGPGSRDRPGPDTDRAAGSAASPTPAAASRAPCGRPRRSSPCRPPLDPDQLVGDLAQAAAPARARAAPSRRSP